MIKVNNIVCIGGNSKIDAPNGVRFIKDLEVGDLVYSYDLSEKNIVATTVLRTAKSYHKYSAILHFSDNSSLSLTFDHPVWIEGKGWSAIKPTGVYEKYGINVNPIKIGDRCLRFHSGDKELIVIKEIELVEDGASFYCIGVKENNFIANGILVHDENLAHLNLKDYGVHFVDLKNKKDTPFLYRENHPTTLLKASSIS